MYIVTRDTPYYNSVTEFNSLEDAEEFAKQTLEDYTDFGHTEEFKICIAEVKQEFAFTPEDL